MRKVTMRLAAGLMISAVFALPAFAQDQPAHSTAASKYVVSAKAGGVNVVEGSVGVVRKNGLSGVLVKGDSLKVGERVSTGPDGKAEILLNPGSFVRIGPNSAFEFRSVALEDLKLVVHRGSAIFELFASEDYTVDLFGPDSRYVVVESGVFRLDVVNNKSSLSVWKGKARVGNENGELLKGGRETRSANGLIVVAKFDRDEKDELDRWSKARSKELAKMIASLDKRSVRSSLINSYAGRQWDMFGSFGLWVYDSFRGSYCFLPFGYGWSSPYGYGYGRWLNWYDFPPVYYYPRSPRETPGGGAPPTTGTPTNPTTPTTPPSRTEQRQRGWRVPSGQADAPPPFVQMQRQEGRSIRPVNDQVDMFPTPSRGSGIVFAPPSSGNADPNSTSKRP
jgi:hypothetical protein